MASSSPNTAFGLMTFPDVESGSASTTCAGSTPFAGIRVRVAWPPYLQVRLRNNDLCMSKPPFDGVWLARYRLWFRADCLYVNLGVWVLCVLPG